MLNVDTHVLLYAVSGSLKADESRLLTTNRWNISAIVLWEIAKLAALALIAASLVHGIPLLTRDRALRKSKLVPLAIG